MKKVPTNFEYCLSIDDILNFMKICGYEYPNNLFVKSGSWKDPSYTDKFYMDNELYEKPQVFTGIGIFNIPSKNFPIVIFDHVHQIVNIFDEKILDYISSKIGKELFTICMSYEMAFDPDKFDSIDKLIDEYKERHDEDN